ncbi:hypothetical protein M2164_003437 [Streptomyces sp. SAI-208]|nr:hypothetical protein [Streptomyces sp. SAI-208]
MTVRNTRTAPWLGGRRALSALVPVAVAVMALGAPTARAADAGAPAARETGFDDPDLAMVVTGGAGRTEAVRSDEPYFTRLGQLLRPMCAGTERVSDTWQEGRCPPVRMTVTRGLTGVGGRPQTNSAPGSEVAVERQNQLFLTGDGTPWVRTNPVPEREDDDILRHRASRAAFDQLDRAGLLGGAGEGGLQDGGGGEEGDADGAWWAVPGVAVGFAAGMGGTRLIRRAAARPGAGPPREEPRQELIDL